jgi:hypothetical protein
MIERELGGRRYDANYEHSRRLALLRVCQERGIPKDLSDIILIQYWALQFVVFPRELPCNALLRTWIGSLEEARIRKCEEDRADFQKRLRDRLELATDECHIDALKELIICIDNPVFVY